MIFGTYVKSYVYVKNLQVSVKDYSENYGFIILVGG